MPVLYFEEISAGKLVIKVLSLAYKPSFMEFRQKIKQKCAANGFSVDELFISSSSYNLDHSSDRISTTTFT